MAHVLGVTLAGTVRFDTWIPSEAFTAAFFPVVVGALAFAGPSGMQQMWYTLWLRDKGAGMGSHIPRVRGLLHAEEEESIPEAGSMFDVDDPEEWRKWQGWRKWVTFDAIVLFFGITMLVTIIFTVMAMNAAELNPEARAALLEGDRDAALPAMADAFAEAAGIFDTLFFIFISLVGFKASVGLFDAFARGQSDMTYYFLPGAKRLKMAHLYGLYLWFVIIFGIIILNFGPADGPEGILDILAFLSAPRGRLAPIAPVHALFRLPRNLAAWHEKSGCRSCICPTILRAWAPRAAGRTPSRAAHRSWSGAASTPSASSPSTAGSIRSSTGFG